MRKLFKEGKLFKGGNYMRKYGILFKTLAKSLVVHMFFFILSNKIVYQGVLSTRQVWLDLWYNTIDVFGIFCPEIVRM